MSTVCPKCGNMPCPCCYKKGDKCIDRNCDGILEHIKPDYSGVNSIKKTVDGKHPFAVLRPLKEAGNE